MESDSLTELECMAKISYTVVAQMIEENSDHLGKDDVQIIVSIH